LEESLKSVVPVAASNSWNPGSATRPRTIRSGTSISIFSSTGEAERLGLDGEEAKWRGGSVMGGDEDLEAGIDMADMEWLPNVNGVAPPGAVLDPDLAWGWIGVIPNASRREWAR